MTILALDDIRVEYHDYLLKIHKDWNKPGTKTDTAGQRVSDTFYLYNNDDKTDFWKYLAGYKDIEDAYAIIKNLLKGKGADSNRQNDYCRFFDDFKVFIDEQLGGIAKIVDEEHIEFYGEETLDDESSAVEVDATRAAVDTETLEKAILWFTKFIAIKQQEKDVDFYSGFMEKNEGYKRALFENGHAALNLDSWSETMIGTGKILAYVVAGLEAKDNSGSNNIVNYHYVTNLKKKASADLNTAEDILYNLFKGNDDKAAFEDACDFFGRWYPTFSYLMFLKDDTKYLPVMNSDRNHGDRFRKLNISRDCLRYCSWNNYQVFLEIHKQIQDKLIEALPSNQVSFLDAHSFVWTLYAAPEDFKFEMEQKLESIPGAISFVESTSSQINYRKKA